MPRRIRVEPSGRGFGSNLAGFSHFSAVFMLSASSGSRDAGSCLRIIGNAS